MDLRFPRKVPPRTNTLPGAGRVPQLGAQAQLVVNRAVAHASSAEQVTAATEQQGASTQEMAAAAGDLLQAAEKLRGLVRGFRT